ncbi:Cobaltochelatase cobN subunit [Granulibacter bethesdensis]|uniref:cobaltochelatase subunit CobN n=1 Tax=Granulibacter bethesdensis TaxID=364410 RepID=UPI00090C571E|nr:cobaltochelatase subunit CobN [Granulibacter bethesdensis]APH56465.1 Cobaltochelatase cobN subunit [Granulibacter bethesdensis]
MHLLVRETRSLEQADQAQELGQSPGDVVFLSFSDSDLGAARTGWADVSVEGITLRLANLARLRHPMSVDLYLEQTVAGSGAVLLRLLGGAEYWRYGLEELAALCRNRAIPFAVIPGDGRPPDREAKAAWLALGTVREEVWTRLDMYCRHGGPENLGFALRVMTSLSGKGVDEAWPVRQVPSFGIWREDRDHAADGLRAVLVFYRSYWLAGDMAPVEAMTEALHARGFSVSAVFIDSLKNPACARSAAEHLRLWRPHVVLNATGFSARIGEDGTSPLDAADAPVIQLVLSASTCPAWQESTRGLSQSDLAMQVVLPEYDGRLLGGVVSFKQDTSLTVTEDGEALDGAALAAHMPYEAGIAMAADRALGWARLAQTGRQDRRIAVVLSDYPGAEGQSAHAVGLDSIASLRAMLDDLKKAGYRTGETLPDEVMLARMLCLAPPDPIMSLSEYQSLFMTLPEVTRLRMEEAWGAAEDDPSVVNGCFHLRVVQCGHIMMAVQPDRGERLDRKAGYHDPDLPPRHAYAAFYLWLRGRMDVHAMIHLGAHGTLEWLPGKAVALSEACYPAALLRGLPVIYPFIVNNPGEAAAAKRRLGAVLIGHLTPPLGRAGLHGDARMLERLLDEYAAADGLDRARTALLKREILDRAAAAGLLAESGVSAGEDEDTALARLDAFLCDVKDIQIRDGLHVFGRAPDEARRAALLTSITDAAGGQDKDGIAVRLDACAGAERHALLAALDGRFIPPGPAGAPSRGRADVLPTGRNLTAIDPRAVPTRSAWVLAERNAAALLERHMRDHGLSPRTLVLDLWGSATMRTGGEDLALGLVLMGVRPVWHEGSARVSGVETVPLAVLDRPRVDVTLRVSGLFRDVFADQMTLFDMAVGLVVALEEPEGWNPLAESGEARPVRIYGAPPGSYGAGATALTDRGVWQSRDELGAAYLDASSYAYGQHAAGQDRDGLAARVAEADIFLHQQDNAETDLLDTTEVAAHEGGFAAASAMLGAAPTLYHADLSTAGTPRMRLLSEELARVVRGRAANPVWLRGMMQHGFRGAAEIARGVEGLFAFAAMLPQRLDAQFEALYSAIIEDSEVDAFMAQANESAHAAMKARFAEAIRRDLWRPRRNSLAADSTEALET